MGLIKDLKTKTITELVNITDAAYEGDPEGTDANSVYFIQNVHPFMQQLGIALQPENTKYVGNLFSAGATPLGDPYFTTIAEAYTSIGSGSGQSNKALIYLCNKGSTYDENLTLSANGYVILEGVSKFGTVLSGTVQISAGIHIFRNIKFTGQITIGGGSVVFENCCQTAGMTSITGSSTVIISKSDYWGNIGISEALTGVKLWCENILNMAFVDIAGEQISILVPSTLVSPQIVLRGVAAQGTYSDTGNLITEISGFESYISARPII